MPAFASMQRQSAAPASPFRARSGLANSIADLDASQKRGDALSLEGYHPEAASAVSDAPSNAPRHLQWNFANISIYPPDAAPFATNRMRLNREVEVDQHLPDHVRRLNSAPSGDKLPGSVEASFSRKFGQDLSHVSIHRDHAASRAVHRIGASAFVRGSQIFFGDGAFQPHTASGQALLAHELAHVVQQTRSPSASHAGPSISEEYARRASSDQLAGSDFLDAGPAAPLTIAADTGVAVEDEVARASVLLSDDELADKALDLQAAADKRREAVGGTDITAGKLDEKALQITSMAQASVAHKHKAKAKGKKNKTKDLPSGPNSSLDLTNATDDQVEDHLHALRHAQILNPDPKERARLGQEIENTERIKDTRAAVGRAKQMAQAQALMRGVSKVRIDISSLEEEVVASNERRRSTSSLITGPIHAYGGAWTQLEPADFAPANMDLNGAIQAIKDGNLQYARYLIGESSRKYVDLQSQFDEYNAGIERGGNRVIKVLKVAKTAGRVAASEFDPTGGFLYGSAQDVAGQASEVAYGQRESIDFKGIAVDNAINTAVSRVAGLGSSAVGEAASPVLSQLGRFSGVARQGLEYTTSTYISSELTGTNFGENLTDPSNLFAHGFGQAIGAAKAQSKGNDNAPLPPEHLPPQTDVHAASGTVPAESTLGSPAAPGFPPEGVLPLPVTPSATIPGLPARGSLTHASEPPSTTASSSPTPTAAEALLTGPQPNSIKGGGQGSGKPRALLFDADKITGANSGGSVQVDASNPLLTGKTAANDNNMETAAQAARQILQPTGTGDVVPAKMVDDGGAAPAPHTGAMQIRASGENPSGLPPTTLESPQGTSGPGVDPQATAISSGGKSSPPPRAKPSRPRRPRRPRVYLGGGEDVRKGFRRASPLPPVEFLRPGSPQVERPQLSPVDQARVQEARDATARLGRPLSVKVKAASPQGAVVRSGFAEHLGGGGMESTAQVLATGGEIGHQFAQNASLDNGVPGQEKASHAEKQAAMENPNQPLAVDKAMCADCFGFFRRLAVARGTSQVIYEPGVAWVFHPDGTAVGISSGAQVVLHPDGSAITDPIPAAVNAQESGDE